MPFETDVRENVFAAPAGGAIGPELWLLGQPPLRDYLDFVRELVVGGDAMDQRALCDEWRVANDRYYDLERSEAGYVDAAECLELPAAMRPLADELARHPHFRHTSEYLPATFGMVELGRLIVYQPHVTLPFVETLQARLAPAPDAEGLFRFCQPAGVLEAGGVRLAVVVYGLALGGYYDGGRETGWWRRRGECRVGRVAAAR